jgi:hypothetical protein
MRLAPPRKYYDANAELDRNQALETADDENHKKGRDIEVGAQCRVTLTSPSGLRFWLAVDDAGALTVTAVP